MKNVTRFDRGEVKEDAFHTDEGYIRANAIVTRTGVFNYQNPDGSIRRELRHPSDVWEKESIDSMKMIPVTNNHPEEKLVTSFNSKKLIIGYTGETIERQDPYVYSRLVITDQDAIDYIVNQGRKELSLGYTVDLEETPGVYEGQEYDSRQKNIRYNHLAIVDKARAGERARISLDADDAVEILEKEVKLMSKRKIKIDEMEVVVEENVASYVSRLEEDLRNLQDEKDRVERERRNLEEESRRVEEEILMIKDRLEKAEGERDALRSSETRMSEDKSTKMDSIELQKAVQERIAVLKIAELHLDGKVIDSLNSMSNLEIKKQIISSSRPSIDLSNKSEVYLDAMYDTIVDDSSKRKVNTSNVIYSEGNVDRADSVDLVNARQKMMKNLNKASK